MFNRKIISIAVFVLVLALASAFAHNKFFKHYDVVTVHGVNVCKVKTNSGGKYAYFTFDEAWNFNKKSSGCDIIELSLHPMDMSKKKGFDPSERYSDYTCPNYYGQFSDGPEWSGARMKKCSDIEEKFNDAGIHPAS